MQSLYSHYSLDFSPSVFHSVSLICNFQVSSLVVESCDDLVLNLDLRGLNLSSVRTVIRNSNRVVLETVLADYRHSFAQTYHLAIKKVKNATLSGVELVSSVLVSANLR